MTENQLNKMFTNGHINMHTRLGSRLFTMPGSSVCKGNIQYSMSLIITFWLNKQKWEGCLFLIMLMHSFLMHLTNMVHREMFSFCVSGRSIMSRFSGMRGVKRREQIFVLCVKCRGHFKPARAPRDFWRTRWIDCTSEGCFTFIQQYSFQKILSILDYYIDRSLTCMCTYVYVCRILFTAPQYIFSLVVFYTALKAIGYLKLAFVSCLRMNEAMLV